MKHPKIYQSVTANIHPDGSPFIIAWRGGTFDSIPISDGKGGTIPKVSPVDPRHLAALVAAARAAEKMLSGLFREIDLPGEWETGTGDSIDTIRAALAPFTPDPAPPVSPPALVPFGDGTWYRCDRPELFDALESLGFRRSAGAVEANVMSGIPAKAVAAGLVSFPTP